MKSPELEIEVAYLAKEIPEEMKGVQPILLRDVYISDDSDLLNKMRLRQKGADYELTKKVVVDPSDLSTQEEYNTPLTRAEFDKFCSLAAGEVVKERYETDIQGYKAEIDVFKGPLSGLVIIEFEFPSKEDKDLFQAPECCLAEVTQEDFIAGSYLAGKSYDDISSELERFNYEAIRVNP